jgi:hypothetical protein
VEFCQSLGCYDEIITYDQAQTLDKNEPIMIVDMAGNLSSMRDLHEHFQDNVKYSCSVGATHQANQKDFNVGNMNSFPGATPTFFFAPTQAQKRTEEWGPGEVQKRIGLSLKDFQQFSDQWMQINRGRGFDVIETTFAKVVKGGISPHKGLILSV